MYEASIVPFYENDLITVEVNGEHYVAMKPIVEGMGLDWRGQQAKLRASQARFGVFSIPLETKGGIQEMLCIPLAKLNGWLFSVNPEKVRPDIRRTVELYQEECFIALHDYWQRGQAINPRFREKNSACPSTFDLRERLALIEMKRRLLLSLQRVPYSGQISLKISLNEISQRLGENPLYPDLTGEL